MSDVVPAPSLRIALAMRGGVSLSVWIGGGVREIERFRHDVILGDEAPARSVLAAIARAVQYETVEVDVIAGASAGGLNAVILGTAMTNGKRLDMLRDVWLDAAAIENLVYKSSLHVRLSILDGDYFYNQLVANLHKLMDSDSDDARLIAERADVMLSVTSIVPIPVSVAPDPSAPVTEQRIGGQIHLRRRQPGYDDDCCAPVGIDDFAKERIDDLAFAARSTASFPVAFAPVKLDEHRMVGNIDFRPKRPHPMLLFDGGVSDNMPVGKAAAAINSAPADGATRRVLLYLHPSPGVPDVAAAARQIEERDALAAKGARALDVIKTSMRSLRTKSLLEDLQAIEKRNTTVEESLRDRDRLLETIPALPPDQASVIAPELDAERLIGLFVEPWEHVADLVPPMEFEPRLGSWTGADLDLLQGVLTDLLARVHLDAPGPLPMLSRHSLRPWGALIRSASLLIEWCRWAESFGVKAVSPAKQKVYLIREHAYRRASCLNAQTLTKVVGLPPNRVAAAQMIVDDRTPFVEAQLADIAEQWSALADLAVEIRKFAPSLDTSIANEHGGELHAAFDALFPIDSDATCARTALDRLDYALLPLHRGAPLGSLDRVDYHTISGSAGTPLSASFAWPSPAVAPELVFLTLRPMPREPSSTNTVEFDPRRIDPGSKLAGNQLHNFSAFLQRNWRANDWMWGQVDAASSLVDLVLDPSRLDQLLPNQVEDLVTELREACTGPLQIVAGQDHRWSGAVVEAATRLWSDAVVAKVTEELSTSSMPADNPVPLTRALVLWRRHIEIVAGELDRVEKDNPTGREAGDTLSESMADWDDSPRQLSAVWGERKVTAIGMRAVFVGWRALFARAPWFLRIVRALLAPVLAPVAGFVLSRRRTAVALELFLIGCVMPRAYDHDVGRIFIGLLGVGLGLAILLVTREIKIDPDTGKVKRKFDLFTEGWSITTLVLMVVLIVEGSFVSWPWFRDVLPTAARKDGGVLPYLLPVVAVMLIAFITFYWAKFRWRLLVTVLNGAIMWFWVWFGASAASLNRDINQIGGFVAIFASLWWGVLALVLVTTLLGYNVDLANVKDPKA